MLPTSPYFRLEELAPGVYAAIVVPGTGAWGNAGIVDLGDRTLVFDTFYTPSAAEELKRVAGALTGRTVSLVVSSHYHADHTLGNGVFGQATVIATRRTRELMAERNSRFLETARAHPEYPDQVARQLGEITDPALRKEKEAELGELRALVKDLPGLTLRLPDVAFDGKLVLHGSRRSVEVLHLGGGHTPSDSVLLLPEERIVFAGDLFQNQFQVMLRHGDPEEWVRRVGELLDLEADTYVPGHGLVGGKAQVAMVAEYIADLQQIASELARTGGRAEEASVPGAYAQWEIPSLFEANLQFLCEREQTRQK